MTTVLKIEGMTCQNCARHVRESLQEVPGVEYAEVDLDAARARVKGGDADKPEVREMVEAVARAGYSAIEVAEGGTDAKKGGFDLFGWKANAILSLTVAVALMGAEEIFHPAMQGWFGWASMAVALPVQVICGWRFYQGAWRQLLVGQANMDMLVALGSTTAFLLSVYGLIAPGRVHHTYFAEAAMILGLISLGHYLETRVGERASGALSELMRLAPQTARRIGRDGTEEDVAVAALVHGDRVILRPGDQAPADGEVVEGSSAVDEAMLTGESEPVEKAVGGKIYTGTINQNGRLVVAVTGLGEETALASIIEVVRRAQGSRANIQKIGDRVSSVFVPVVVVIAAGSAIYLGMHGAWEAGIMRAAGVLIVACPCAMGLATPAAIMAGTNAAAKRGILVRDGSALEKCGRITAVLFDKTGTLTEGKARVTRFETMAREPGEVRAIAKGLAGPSRHPYSKAISDYLRDVEAEDIGDWREERGLGVSGIWKEMKVFLGSMKALVERGIARPVLDGFTGTVVGLAVESELVAEIQLADGIKKGAKEVLGQLRDAGLRAYVVSGDSKAATAEVAGALGIAADHVFAEVRPEGKAEIVGNLQRRWERVAFVGDGINDGPALATADLGIAVMRASDVAREAADIVLLQADIEAIPEALDICRATLRTIKQNLFWAFFYNAAAIPLAVLGMLPPVACAAAMAVSDLCVIGNSLRLLRKGQKRSI